MDRSAIFQQLGVGVKFDLKRFEKDALKLQVKNSSPALINGNKTTSPTAIDKQHTDAPHHSPTQENRVKVKRKRKRKRAAVSQEPEAELKVKDETTSSSTPKKIRLASANSDADSSANDNFDDDIDDDENENVDDEIEKEPNGVIQLLTGVRAGNVPPGADAVKKRRKKKTKKNDSSSASSDPAKRDEELNAFRNSLKINVKGTDIAEPLKTFEGIARTLKLNPIVAENIEKFGFDEPTPIQMQAVPVMASG